MVVYFYIIGALAKLRKVTNSFLMLVYPSVRLPVLVEQLSSHWSDFRENLYWSFSRKSVQKIQISFESAKNKAYYT